MNAAGAAQAEPVSRKDFGSLLLAARRGVSVWEPLRFRFSVLVPETASQNPASMSGFSPELIDYLEGKISFEEFERRREERKTREKKVRR